MTKIKGFCFTFFVTNRSNAIQHRCVTHLYGIPALSFYRSEVGLWDTN